MAIIYTYPSGAVKADDLIIVSEQDAAGSPTKNITVSDLANFIITTGAGTGTTDYIVKWNDGPNGILGDSPAFTFDGGAGLKQLILTDGYRFVVDRDAATTVGDPEYAITQSGVTKTSFGWDDDGGGYGFLYNWEGNGFKFGSTTLYPQLELITSPDIKIVSFSDFEFDADIIDIGGNVGNAGEVLSSLGAGNGVQWIVAGGAGVSDITTATGVSTGDPISPLAAAAGSVTITSNSYAGTTNVGYVPTGGSATTFLRGDGTWVTPGGGGTVAGSGTTDYIPRWTPNGTTLGDSQIQDDGTIIDGTALGDIGWKAGVGGAGKITLSAENDIEMVSMTDSVLIETKGTDPGDKVELRAYDPLGFDQLFQVYTDTGISADVSEFSVTTKAAGTGINLTTLANDILLDSADAIKLSGTSYSVGAATGAWIFSNASVEFEEPIIDSLGSTGLASEVLKNDGTGKVVWSSLGVIAVPWPYQYDAVLDIMIQGDNPGATGTENTGYGVGALNLLSTGSHNVAIGDSAAKTLTTGNDNIIIGSDTAVSNLNGQNQIVIGYGVTSHGDNTAVLGNSACTLWEPDITDQVDLGSVTYSMKDYYASGEIKLALGTSRIGIGNAYAANTKGAVEVNAYIDYNGSPFDYYLYGPAPPGTFTAYSGPSLYAISYWGIGRFMGSGIHIFSDERSKIVHGVSNSENDLKIINEIEITDFNYIDPVKGSGNQKKVIAQQVEKVYPSAVSTGPDTIPDIFRQTELNSGVIKITNSCKTGDKIKLIFKDTTQEIVQVLEANENEIIVDCKRNEEVFVYGTEVDDYKSVDYDSISMLNVSATQELHKIITKLTKKVEDLTEKVNSLENK